MGDTTDELIALAREVTDQPEARELDLLLSTGEIVSAALVAMALNHMGRPAVALSGSQAGIRTDPRHGKARIANLDPKRIHRELDAGRIVIVAGFQGITEEMEITTLGRGASDTTAVALAAALKAERAEIYTDVEGIFTADPRIVPEAAKFPELSYEEMLEMASYGAQVMHPRAVELGAVHKVPIYVASSFSEATGTLIHGGPFMEQHNKVLGIAQDTDVARITIRGVPGPAGNRGDALRAAGRRRHQRRHDRAERQRRAIDGHDVHGVAVGPEPGAGDREAGRARDRGAGRAGGHAPGEGEHPRCGDDVGGRATRGGCSAPCSRRGINIELITTSEIRITCLIDEKQVKDAVRALHKAFELEEG